MSADALYDSAPVVTLVTASGCHFCDEALTALRALIDAGVPIRLEVVAATSDLGRILIARHRPAMNPLVLVDSSYFSAGRLPRRKLEALLRRRGLIGAEVARRG
jgi:acetyl esterase/lipase